MKRSCEWILRKADRVTSKEVLILYSLMHFFAEDSFSEFIDVILFSQQHVKTVSKQKVFKPKFTEKTF